MFILDIIIFLFFVGVMVWMIISYSREDEQVDLALLLVRYGFQIFRFFIYIAKTNQKIKERSSIQEIAIGDQGDKLEDGFEIASRPSSDSDGLDHIRRKTDLII